MHILPIAVCNHSTLPIPVQHAQACMGELPPPPPPTWLLRRVLVCLMVAHSAESALESTSRSAGRELVGWGTLIRQLGYRCAHGRRSAVQDHAGQWCPALPIHPCCCCFVSLFVLTKRPPGKVFLLSSKATTHLLPPPICCHRPPVHTPTGQHRPGVSSTLFAHARTAWHGVAVAV